MNRTVTPAVAAALLATGCIPPEDLAETLQEIKPDVTFQGLELVGLDFDGADAELTFTVDNPNAVGLTLSSFAWGLDFGGLPFVEGIDDEGFTLEPWGTSDVVVPVSVDFAELVELVQLARGEDTVPWQVRGAFGFDGIFDEVTVPFEHGGDFPALRRPETSVEALRLDGVDWWTQEADLSVDLAFTNPGGPIGIESFSYAIEVEGHEVASGWLDSVDGLDGTEVRQVSLPVGIDLRERAAAVVDAVLDETAGIEVGFQASADVRTPFGTVPWDVSRARVVSLD